MESEIVVLLFIYAVPVIIFVPESEKTMESHYVSELFSHERFLNIPKVESFELPEYCIMYLN
jgi:hypothetical protein